MADNKQKQLKKGQRVAFTAALITLFLVLLKGLVGHLFNSKVLIADAFHSAADLAAILASGFGLWFASRKKTKKFPYGLFKAENIVSLVIGLLILFAGARIFWEGYEKIIESVPVTFFPYLPVSVSLLSIIISFFIARKEKAVGMEINSGSLKANASESFLDIFTSSVVLAGIMFSYFHIPYIEGCIIILISILIFKLGITTLWTSILVLVDANLDPILQSEIEKQVNAIYGVKGVSEVMIRQSGPFKMVECKIFTKPSLPLYKAHELADKAEDFIINNHEHIESVFIHVEPSMDTIVSAIIPVREINGLDSLVHGHFGRSPYFIILKIDEESVDIEDFYMNEFLSMKTHIGIKVIKSVIKYRLDLLFTNQIGEISYSMLKNNFIDIYSCGENNTVKEVIKKYRLNQISRILAPTHSHD